MAIVVESISTLGTATNTANVTVTAPTGIEVGDLLVLTLFGVNQGGTAQTPTASGWTNATTLNATDTSSTFYSIQYKVAISADTTATSYTFATTGVARQIRAKILRLSGFAPSVLFGAASSKASTDSGTTFSASPSSYTPISDGGFIITQVGGDAATSTTTSGYTIPGVTPIETIDLYATFGGQKSVLASAYGIQTTATAVDSYAATFSQSTSNHRGQIAIFQAPKNVSVGNTLTTTTSTAFSQPVFAEATTQSILTTTTTEAFSQGGRGTSPDVWVDKTKTSGTWTDQTK
jgi:hypothetical protein